MALPGSLRPTKKRIWSATEAKPEPVHVRGIDEPVELAKPKYQKSEKTIIQYPH